VRRALRREREIAGAVGIASRLPNLVEIVIRRE